MAGLLRIRLDLSFDGTDFAGWAAQPGRRTVAGTLSDGLAVLFRASVPLVVAGRTDAGVHATGQVAHIDVLEATLIGLTPRDLEPTRDAALVGLLRRLAGLLPADLRVRAAVVAAAGFDARFSALRRHYRYRISTAPWGAEPLRRKDTWALRRPLDVVTMNLAAQALMGLHDFAAFCLPREGATTIRDLQHLCVDAEDTVVTVDVTADAFCHSMIRALVGSLVRVGTGQRLVTTPAELLAGRRRTPDVSTAPAHGLTLTGVDYPPDAELAVRATQTRALRSAPPR